MVHHSIAVVMTSFLTNFLERRVYELRLTRFPRSWVNSGDHPATGMRRITDWVRPPGSSSRISRP